MEIGFLGALIGGVLTLLSPCSVMLLPSFFSYAFTSPTQLLSRAGVFYLGLITTLVPLGVLAGTLGAFVSTHRFTFVNIAAIIVIILGTMMFLGIQLPFSNRGQGAASSSPLAVYALGTVYGLAGVCAGPLLGAVLTVAAVSGNALYGGIVLLFFAAGMALPVFILALTWGRLPFVKKLVRPREVRIGRWRNSWTALVGGALTILLGVLLIATNGTSSLGGVLSASAQSRLEGSAYASTQNIPDVVVLLAVLAISAIALLVTRLRRRAAQKESEITETP